MRDEVTDDEGHAWVPPAPPELTDEPVVERAGAAPDAEAEEAGHAHVATASFLAARLAPGGGFMIALAGGLTLARLSARNGWRAGYGASIAATLQTVAIIGPLRFQIPFTQAVSAPMVGRQDAAGVAPWLQVICCAAIRLTLALAALTFHIWIILGGIGAYADAYDGLLGWLPLVPEGQTPAVVLALTLLVSWTVIGSIIQVLVYRRGLRDWPDEDDVEDGASAPPEPELEPELESEGVRAGQRPRFDARAVILSAGLAFAMLLISHEWALLGAVTLWLALAWLLARGDREPVKPGFVLAGLLAVSVLFAGVIGQQGILLTLERTTRALLLVLVATWMRAAAGEEGLREVARRSLRRLRRLPAAREASDILDRLGNERGLLTSGKALVEGVRGVEHEHGKIGSGRIRDDIVPLAKAVLAWSAAETRRYRRPSPAQPARLTARPPDGLLVLAVLAAAAALAAPIT